MKWPEVLAVLYTKVRDFRITPEFKILRLTSVSKTYLGFNSFSDLYPTF